jgi:hypothetical protein
MQDGRESLYAYMSPDVTIPKWQKYVAFHTKVRMKDMIQFQMVEGIKLVEIHHKLKEVCYIIQFKRKCKSTKVPAGS